MMEVEPASAWAMRLRTSCWRSVAVQAWVDGSSSVSVVVARPQRAATTMSSGDVGAGLAYSLPRVQPTAKPTMKKTSRSTQSILPAIGVAQGVGRERGVPAPAVHHVLLNVVFG